MKSVVAIPEGWNPLDHLGAISFYLFWIVAVTGVYLFVFFETSISSAWHSVEVITHEQFYISLRNCGSGDFEGLAGSHG